jgi:hypothetical protein
MGVVFGFHGYITRCGVSVFKQFEELPKCFPKQLHHFAFPLSFMRVPISLHPCQDWLLSALLLLY